MRDPTVYNIFTDRVFCRSSPSKCCDDVCKDACIVSSRQNG